MPLTPDEKDTLTALEHQLRADDPVLARALTRGPRPPRTPGGHVLRAREIVLLIVALLVLAVFGSAVEDHAGALGLGAMTSLLIVPWLITSARAAAHRQDSASTARAPRSDEGDALRE